MRYHTAFLIKVNEMHYNTQLTCESHDNRSKH